MSARRTATAEHRDVTMWMCSIAADCELGHTDVKLYPTKAALLRQGKCVGKGPMACKPVKVYVRRASADFESQVDEFRHAVGHVFDCNKGTVLCDDCKRLLRAAMRETR